MATLLAKRVTQSSNRWEEDHNAVIGRLGSPYPPLNMFDNVIAGMLQRWAAYAEIHEKRFGSKIGDDGVLGPEWENIGLSIRGLLNGELGRLDGGTCDAFILDTLSENGINIDLL